MFAGVGFVNDLAFEKNGVLGRERGSGIYRMLNPGLNGFAHDSKNV